MKDVIVLYALVGLCLILAYTMFSESHIFLGLLAVIFGICLMIQMAGSIGWFPVLAPVIIIVGIVIVVYLIKFIYIMITANTSKTTKVTEKQTTTPKYTEEDIREFADRMSQCLMNDVWMEQQMRYPDYVSKFIDSIIQKMNVPQSMAFGIHEDVAEMFECMYFSKTRYLKDVMDSLELSSGEGSADFFFDTPIGRIAAHFLPDVYSLDSVTMYSVIERVNTIIEQEYLESEMNDAQFSDRYRQVIKDEIANAMKERGYLGQAVPSQEGEMMQPH